MSEPPETDPHEETWKDVDDVYARLMLGELWTRHVLADRTVEFYKDASPDRILEVWAAGVNAVQTRVRRRDDRVLATTRIGPDGVPDLARQLEAEYGRLDGDE